MNKKSDKSTAVNSITGKTIQEMSWEEIRAIKGKSLKKDEFIAKIKSIK